MSVRATWFLIPLLVFVLHSCSFQPLEFQSIRGAEIEEKEDGERIVNIKFQVYNPNGVGFQIKKIDLTVFVDSQRITQIKEKNIAKAPPQDYFTVPLAVDFSPKQFKELIPTDFQTIMQNPKLSVQVKGMVLGQKMLIIRKKYDIDYEKELSLQDISNIQ